MTPGLRRKVGRYAGARLQMLGRASGDWLFNCAAAGMSLVKGLGGNGATPPWVAPP
jgi:hypothetical protein